MKGEIDKGIEFELEKAREAERDEIDKGIECEREKQREM